MFCKKLSRRRFQTVILAVVGVSILAGGCASTKPPPSVLDDSTVDESLPLIALAGYRDNENFFIEYRVGNRVFYGGGNWSERVELVEDPAPIPKNYAVPTLVPIQYRQSTPWESLPEDLVEIPVFPVEHGRALAVGIDGAVLVEVEGLGHEIPDPFLTDLVPLLLRHLAGASEFTGRPGVDDQ